MHTAFTRDLSSFPLPPDQVVDAQQKHYLAAKRELSPYGDTRIPH
jgi:hypothetical protein